MLEIKIKTVDWQQRPSHLFFSIITFTLCKYNHEEVFMLAFFPHACSPGLGIVSITINFGPNQIGMNEMFYDPDMTKFFSYHEKR